MHGLRLRRIPRWLCASLIALLFTAAATRHVVAQGDPTIFVVNRASQSIYYLHVSPTNSTSWGPDLLGSGVISTGERFRVSPARGNCRFDVKVIYANDREEERRNVNFCEISELVFTGTGTTGGNATNADFDLVNNSQQEIYRLRVSPVTSDSWGEDRLGDDTLPAGRRFSVTLPRDGTCQYDIKVEYRDGRVEERRNVNLCTTSQLAFDGSRATTPTPPETTTPPPNAGGNPSAPRPPVGGGGLGFGTGFFVTAQGHALTNDHVAGECSAVTAIVDGRRLPAQLIQRDERNDLALLRVQTSGAVPYAFFRSQTIRAGDDVAAVGFPLPDALSNTLNFSRGNIQALSGVGGNAGLFTMNAPINPGNSGGPVLDMGGNVVGIAVSRLESAQNVNFAIKQSVAQALLEAQDVAFEERPMTDRPLPPADLRDKGKTFTFQIECRS